MDNSGASPLATGLSPSVEPVPVSPAVAASIPNAYDAAAINLWWREDTRRRTTAAAIGAVVAIRAANPEMDERTALFSAFHSEIMTIIERLDPEDGCSTVCPSDVAWEVMAALGFNEAQAIDARRAETGTGSVHESETERFNG